MSILYTCPKCGTAMEDPTTTILPSREELLAKNAALLAQLVALKAALEVIATPYCHDPRAVAVKAIAEATKPDGPAKGEK